MLLLDVDVHASGPVFDGVAREELSRYTERLREHLGDIAVSRIREYLPTQYMYLGHSGGDPVHNPVPANAGFLAASVHYDRVSDDTVVVNDDPVSYGAWIEGVDPANLITWRGRVRRGLSPRFPGYHTFRIIGQQLERESLVIAQNDLQPYISLMNA